MRFMERYELLYIRTKAGSKTHKVINGKVFSDLKELLEYAKKTNSEKIVILPDIMYPYRDKVVDIIEKYKNADVVIVKGNQGSIFYKILRRFFRKRQRMLGLITIVSHKILAESSSLDDLVKKTEHVVEIVYNVPLKIHIYMLYGILPDKLATILSEPYRIIKFALVGLSGFFVNYYSVEAVLELSKILNYYIPGVTHFLASSTGFETSLTWNYTWHELWTFKDLKLSRSPLARLKRWLKYHVASIGSFITQTSSVTILSGFFGVSTLISVFIGVALGFIVNYLIGRFYTWSEEQ